MVIKELLPKLIFVFMNNKNSSEKLGEVKYEREY